MNLKKFFATVLAVAAVFTALVVPASAASNPNNFGQIGKEVLSYYDLFGRPVFVTVGNTIGKDNEINQDDATHILHYLLKLDTANWAQRNVIGITVDGIHYPAHWFPTEMDCNGDGDITQVDATMLMRYVLWNDMHG